MKIDKFEQMNMFSIMYDQYKITKPIRLIELFAGIGSQHEALKKLGADVEPYKVVEFDKYTIASYNAVHGTNFETSDITKISASDLEIVDTDKYEYIMTYSFPCQDLSLAGKGKGMQKGSGTRSGLLWEVERLLEECQELPQVLLMENVPQVHSEENMPDFIAWQNKLESLGYTNYWQDLNAKDYGIPQNRNRCFMVSILGKYYYEFPKPFKLELKLKDMLESEVDEKYYLNDKMIKKIIYTNKSADVPICLNSKGGRNGIEGLQPSVQDRVYSINGVSCAITCSFNPNILIPENTVKGYAETGDGDGDGVYINRPHQKRGVVQKDMIQTLKTQCNDVGVCVNSEHNLRIRKLTPKECWRLMGFADKSFDKAEKVNSNAQLYKQAGNSIVVNVLMNIFKQLL